MKHITTQLATHAIGKIFNEDEQWYQDQAEYHFDRAQYDCDGV
jgi:hypothetical protein